MKTIPDFSDIYIITPLFVVVTCNVAVFFVFINIRTLLPITKGPLSYKWIKLQRVLEISRHRG
jgi:hypothetical protein